MLIKGDWLMGRLHHEWYADTATPDTGMTVSGPAAKRAQILAEAAAERKADPMPSGGTFVQRLDWDRRKRMRRAREQEYQ